MSILQRLNPQHRAYLLIDGAQFDHVKNWLHTHVEEPQYQLLYEGTHLANALEVSPCLVDLSLPNHRHLADQFYALSSAHRAGILLSVFPEVSTQDLFEHLQSLLYVTCERTPKAIFRWYAPRVCRHLFEQSSETERAELMGPINTILLNPEAQWLEFNNQTHQTRSDVPYALSSTQLAALDLAVDQTFKEQLVNYLMQHFPVLCANKSVLEIDALCGDWIDQGKQLGFDDHSSLTPFIYILATLGTQCLEQNSPYPEVSQLLLHKSPLTPQQRVEKAAELAAHIRTAQDKEQAQAQERITEMESHHA